MSFSREVKDFIEAYKGARSEASAGRAAAIAEKKQDEVERHNQKMEELALIRANKSGGSGSGGTDYGDDASGASGPDDMPTPGADTSGTAPAQADDGASGKGAGQPHADLVLPNPTPNYLPNAMQPTAFSASGGMMEEERTPQIPPTPQLAQSAPQPAPAAGPKISPVAYELAGRDAKAAMRAAAQVAFNRNKPAIGGAPDPDMSLGDLENVTKAIDPDGQMPGHLRQTIALGQFYNHFKGQPDRAAKAAADMMVANKKATQTLGMLALHAFQKGDLTNATRLFNDAVNRFPGTHEMTVQADPQRGLIYTMTKDGQPLERGLAKPEQLHGLIRQVANGSLYDKEWLQGANAPDTPSTLAGDAGQDTLAGDAASDDAVPTTERPSGGRADQAGTDLVLPEGVTRTQPYGDVAGRKLVGKGKNKRWETYGWQGGIPPQEGTFGHKRKSTGGSGSGGSPKQDYVLPPGVVKTEASSDAPLGYFTITAADGRQYEVPYIDQGVGGMPPKPGTFPVRTVQGGSGAQMDTSRLKPFTGAVTDEQHRRDTKVGQPADIQYDKDGEAIPFAGGSPPRVLPPSGGKGGPGLTAAQLETALPPADPSKTRSKINASSQETGSTSEDYTATGGAPPAWNLDPDAFPHGIPPAGTAYPKRPTTRGGPNLAWPSPSDYRDAVTQLISGAKSREFVVETMLKHGLDPRALPSDKDLGR